MREHLQKNDLKKPNQKNPRLKSNLNIFLMLKFTVEAAAASENIFIVLSKQHFSSLSAYQRGTSSEKRVSKYSLAVIRAQGLITQHLTFSLGIPAGSVI